MPDVPGPEELPSTAERMEKLFGPSAREYYDGNPIDIRHVGPLTVEVAKDPSLRTARSQVWLRADGELPDDPLLLVLLLPADQIPRCQWRLRQQRVFLHPVATH